jgi:hypothetical protein
VARLGLIAEGASEFELLEALVAVRYPGSEVRQIHPEATMVSGFGNGWKGVRAWCRENGSRLETIMSGIEGDELNGLIIHADCSMSQNVGARRACPPASDTANALRTVIITEWLELVRAPSYVVLMTPSESTDTWFFVGAGYAGDPTFAPLECALNIEQELVRRRHYRMKGGEVRKPRANREWLAARTANAWDDVVAACGEAARFSRELQVVAA